MDPAAMKVAELRSELKARGLPAVGKKAELAAALSAALAEQGDGGAAAASSPAAAAAAAAASEDAPVDIDGLVDSAFAVFEQGLGTQGAQARSSRGEWRST